MKRQNKKAISLLGSVALAGCMGLGIGCKKDTPAGPEPAVPVTLQFEVYNHTKGYKTSFTRNITSGQNVNIKISDFGYSDVDPERIAVREGATGGRVGAYTTFSRTGEANFIAPRMNTTYGVFLMNKSNGTNYNLIDSQESKGSTWAKLYHSRYIMWKRVDEGLTGPDSAIREVIDQFNDALNLSWMNYGDLTQVNSNEHITIGYSNELNFGGWHNGLKVRVNPLVCDSIGRDYRGVFIEELFECILEVSDIHGDGSHVNEFDRRLSLEGKELMNYVFAKDEKTK